MLPRLRLRLGRLRTGCAAASATALQRKSRVTKAHYDQESSRLIVTLHNDVELAVPVRLNEGLAGVDSAALSEIERSPSGLGLHWPALDADVFVPALFDGVFGTRSWMASILGAEGGRATSPAKAAAARANGRKGGRPAKRTRIAG